MHSPSWWENVIFNLRFGRYSFSHSFYTEVGCVFAVFGGEILHVKWVIKMAWELT